MSTRTLAIDLSMPNQWARSHELSMSTGHLLESKPNRWERSQLVLRTRQLSMSTQTLASNQSMPNQCAQSHELSMSTGH